MLPLDSGIVSGIRVVFREDPAEVACQEKEKIRNQSALSRIEELVCKKLIGKVGREKNNKQTNSQVHGATSTTLSQKLVDSISMF